MAMKECYECKKEISEHAKACPFCGYVTSRSYRKRVSERIYYVAMLTICVGFIWVIALFTWSAMVFWSGVVVYFIGLFYVDYLIKRDRRN